MQRYIVASSEYMFNDVLSTDSYQDVIEFLEKRKGLGYSFTILDTSLDPEDDLKFTFIYEDQLDVFLDDYYRKEIEKEDPSFFIPEEELDEPYYEDYYSPEDGLGYPYDPPC